MTTSTTSPAPHETARGYGITALGALLGVVVLAGLGIAIGIGLMVLYEDPNGGMENLGLLLYPIGLGAVGTVVGAVVGVRVALRRVGDPLATRTGWMTVPGVVVALGLVPAWGLGFAVLVTVPFAARWLALQTAAGASRRGVTPS